MKKTNLLFTNLTSLNSLEKRNKKSSNSSLNIISCNIQFNTSANSDKNSISDALKHPFQCSSRSFSTHFIVLTFTDLPVLETSLLTRSITSLFSSKMNVHQFLSLRYPASMTGLYNYKLFFSFSEKFTLNNPSPFFFKGFIPSINLFSTESHGIMYCFYNPVNNELISTSFVEVISDTFCSNIKSEDLQFLLTQCNKEI